MELNPSHPVTAGLRDQWQKVLACVLWKYRKELPADVVITTADIDEIVRAFPDMPTIVAHDRSDGCHLSVVSFSDGRELMRKDTERG